MVKLGEKGGDSRSKDWVPSKVWMMMSKDTQYKMRRGDNINIGIVKEDAFHSGKSGGRKFSALFKKNQNKFLNLNGTEIRKTDPAFINEVNDLLSSNVPDY